MIEKLRMIGITLLYRSMNW